MRKITALLVLFFVSVTPALAVTLNLTNAPSSVDQNQEFDVDIALTCESCSDSYLRGVFYPSGTNYFGFTKNNIGEWIDTSSDKTKYFKIGESEVIESSWSGKLRLKPNPEDSAYSGPKNYLFKVIRYTAGGSNSAESQEVTIAIAGPTTAPTSAPTSSPTNTSVPVATSTPKPSPTPKPTKIPTAVPTSQVLAATVEVSPSPPPSPAPTSVVSQKTQPSTQNRSVFAIIIILTGVALLGLSLWLIVRKN